METGFKASVTTHLALPPDLARIVRAGSTLIVVECTVTDDATRVATPSGMTGRNPPPGWRSTSPSDHRRSSASRTGVRDTANRCATETSSSRCPAGSSPRTIDAAMASFSQSARVRAFAIGPLAPSAKYLPRLTFHLSSVAARRVNGMRLEDERRP